MADGRLLWSKVREITRVATGDDEERWVDLAVAETGAQVERTVRAFRRVQPADAAAQHETRRWSWRIADDGSVLITLKLEAVRGAAVIEAVEGSATPQRGVPWGAVCADRLSALVLGDAEATPVEVVVHVDATVLEGGPGVVETEQGVPVAVEVVEQALCDAPVRVATHHPDGSTRLSRRRRFATALQRRRVANATRTCAIPGCHHKGSLQAHHVVHASDHGPTVDENLVLVCPAHHRLIHLHHLRLVRQPDGTITVQHRDGTPVDHPIEAIWLPDLEAAHAPEGLGERLDLDLVLTVLLQPPPVSNRKHPAAA